MDWIPKHHKKKGRKKRRRKKGGGRKEERGSERKRKKSFIYNCILYVLDIISLPIFKVSFPNCFLCFTLVLVLFSAFTLSDAFFEFPLQPPVFYLA
jgi:hypothetical protein